MARKLKKRFPAQQQMLGLTINAVHPSIKAPELRGLTLTNADDARVLVLIPETISVCRLAPYTSWKDLLDNAQETWADLKKIAGHPSLSRLSTRYINRIDIKVPAKAAPSPVAQPTPLALATYFNLGLISPQGIVGLPLESFYIACNVSDPKSDLKCTIQLAAGPSPLIDHVAFTLDIDVNTTTPVPLREADMWTLAETLHRRKNEVFEATITDATRSLFA